MTRALFRASRDRPPSFPGAQDGDWMSPRKTVFLQLSKFYGASFFLFLFSTSAVCVRARSTAVTPKNEKHSPRIVADSHESNDDDVASLPSLSSSRSSRPRFCFLKLRICYQSIEQSRSA